MMTNSCGWSAAVFGHPRTLTSGGGCYLLVTASLGSPDTRPPDARRQGWASDRLRSSTLDHRADALIEPSTSSAVCGAPRHEAVPPPS